jgi:hypothetical protein
MEEREGWGREGGEEGIRQHLRHVYARTLYSNLYYIYTSMNRYSARAKNLFVLILYIGLPHRLLNYIIPMVYPPGPVYCIELSLSPTIV